MFRRVVEYGSTQQRAGFLDAEHLLEALAEMGIEVVQHQMDALRLGIDLLEQVLDEGHEVGFGAAIGDFDGSLATLGLHAATNRLHVPARTYS